MSSVRDQRIVAAVAEYGTAALAMACGVLAGRDLSALDEAGLRVDVETLTRVVSQVTAERLRCAADSAIGGSQARTSSSEPMNRSVPPLLS